MSKEDKVTRSCWSCGLKFRVRKWAGDVRCPACGCS